MTWWRRDRPDPTRQGVARRDELTDIRTGVVLARLEDLVDRFDHVASRLDATLTEQEGRTAP